MHKIAITSFPVPTPPINLDYLLESFHPYNASCLCVIISLLAVRLLGTVADLEHKLEKQSADHARSTVARDLELEALRQQEEKMRLEIVVLKENAERLLIKYK